MKFDVVTIGDAFEDVFVLPEDIKVKEDRSFTTGLAVSFELGEKIPLKEVDYEIGGSACNTAVGFSRLGLETSIVGVIGDDSSASKVLDRLAEEGIATQNIKIDKTLKTNFSVIFRTDLGRTIFIYHGLKDYGKFRVKKSLKSKWFFLAPLGENTTELENDLISHISEQGSCLAWNPGNIQIKKGAGSFRHLLKNLSVLFLNHEESIKFLNHPVRPSDEEIFKKLHLFGPKIIVITNGKNGAKAFDGKNFYQIGVLNNVKRIDSTGAGDSFATGFLGELILHESKEGEFDQAVISEALKWGIINSNSVVTYVGAQKGLLTHSKIEQEIAENPRLKIEIKRL
jgi:sugar/nucleoside kinase (ribokinase family)